MPDPNWRPEGAPPHGNRFIQKLGVYLFGVAIGLAFLGWIQYRKSLATQPAPAPATQQGAPTPPASEPPADPAP
jgi:hypothetical protein